MKQNLPPPVKAVLQQLRARVAPPPVDSVVLAEFRAIDDPNAKPRLTFVVPMLQKGSDFGGTATGIDIFCRLAIKLGAPEQVDVRVLITDVVAETDPSIVIERAGKAGLAIGMEHFMLVTSLDATIGVRAQEIFISYNWWVTLNMAKLCDAQADLFGMGRLPLVWLMQDYEPMFYAYSSAHLLARAAYDSSAPLWGIINSTNLAQFIKVMGHRLEREFVFEPVIADALRPYLARVGSSQRRKRVLVYGRPTVERNCFPALVRGLRRWARDYPEFADWEVVSAGVPHDPVDLGDGRRLTSVGKLSLDDYAAMLLCTSVGVSLMASPHPSYPPLEMAHFGLRTVTNAYVCKDLSDFHPGIISIDSIAEAPLAAAIAEACIAAATPQAPSANPDYIRAEPYPFIDALAEAITAALVTPAPSPTRSES